MLTRRHIRVKVMQAIYAHYAGNHLSLKEGTSAINQSCRDMDKLYFINLSLFKSLWEFASEQNKIQNTNRRSDNPVETSYGVIIALSPLALIANHPFVDKMIADLKINIWELEFDFIRSLYNEIVTSDLFREYQSLENPSFKSQQKFLVQVFKEIIAPNERLYFYIEDLNMQWVDDLPIINTHFLKQLRKLREEDLSSLNFPKTIEKSEDIQFGIDLYEKVVANEEELQKEFEGKTPNWDQERIATLDNLLIKIALAELIYCQDIPPKVTLNEYLEIAKEYSTPKSNQFINGVLDSLVKEYLENDRLNKQGRGLLE